MVLYCCSFVRKQTADFKLAVDHVFTSAATVPSDDYILQYL